MSTPALRGKRNWKVGDEFMARGTGHTWRVTDVGTRTLAAIRVTGEDPKNLVGPPYSVLEVVWDEYDLEDICQPGEPPLQVVPLERVTSKVRAVKYGRSKLWLRQLALRLARKAKAALRGKLTHD